MNPEIQNMQHLQQIKDAAKEISTTLKEISETLKNISDKLNSKQE